MDKKGLIRRKYSLKRKKNYFEIRKSFFNPLVKLIKTKKIKKISLYFPNSYEVNLLKIFELKYFKKFKFLLPIIKENQSMHFHEWQYQEILFVNKYGILEPLTTRCPTSRSRPSTRPSGFCSPPTGSPISSGN